MVDDWLYSTINRRIIIVTQAMEMMKMRRASSAAFLDMWNDVRRYLRRSKTPRRQTLTDVFEAWVKLMSPFTPFLGEDLHRELGGKGLVCQADWPSLKDFPVDDRAELGETLVDRVIEDARNVIKVVKGNKGTMNVYVASDVTRNYFFDLLAARQKNENVGAIVRKYGNLKSPPDRLFKLAYELGEELMARMVANRKLDEYSILEQASAFISSELGISVKVQKSGGDSTNDPAGRAKNALPMKPALYLE